MVRGLALIAVLGALVLPALAEAATVRIGTVSARAEGQRFTDEQVTVRARPGERNDVRMRSVPAPAQGPGEDVLVTDRVPLTPGPGCRYEQRTTRVRCHLRYPLSEAFDRITPPPFRALLGDGDDRFRSTRSADMHGGPGDDRLDGGPDDSLLDGGPGDDRLVGRGPHDVYLAARTPDGADTLVLASDEAIVDYRSRRTPVTLSLDGRRNDGAAGERDRLVAGRGSVDLYGGSGRDVLRMGRGAGSLYGLAGADVLVGGRGSDTLVADRDFERAGRRRDADRLRGGPGDDRLTGNAGANRLDPGTGIDRVIAGGGADIVRLRDRDTDDVLCGGGRDRVVADARDERRPKSACEAFIRAPATPGVMNLWDIDLPRVFESDGSSVTVPVACPIDGPRRCRGVVVLRRGRTVVARGRFSVARERSRYVDARVGTAVRRRDAVSGPVTVELSGRDRFGTARRTRSSGFTVNSPE